MIMETSHPQLIEHGLAPVFDGHSRILILGTLPSPKSRETGFYYGHPQNRFWKVLAGLAGQPVPIGKDHRVAFLLEHRIALWDVCAQCEIKGAEDSSIRHPMPNDVSQILDLAPISAVFTTGLKATELYRRIIKPLTGRDCVYLPSTSPANRALSLDRLIAVYRETFAECGFYFYG